MDSKFFTFIKPALTFVDNGDFFRKPFNWLYTILAALNLLAPIFILISAINNNIFTTPAKYIIVFILVWLVVLLVSWLSFQLWWDRREKVAKTSEVGQDFIATPVFSHFIQTIGEWFGLWVGILGFAFALIATIFLGSDGDFMARQLGMGFLGVGFQNIILMPIYGFLIIVFFRFLAETFRALASIANNTKKI
ncbi:MAG: hypothetical protein ACLFNU_08125 [Bacteroidales bacterium]